MSGKFGLASGKSQGNVREFFLSSLYEPCLKRLLKKYTKYRSQWSIVARERCGSVVECLARDRGAAGWSLTGVTALWSLSQTHLS